jgi:hypothetical protein
MKKFKHYIPFTIPFACAAVGFALGLALWFGLVSLGFITDDSATYFSPSGAALGVLLGIGWLLLYFRKRRSQNLRDEVAASYEGSSVKR